MTTEIKKQTELTLIKADYKNLVNLLAVVNKQMSVNPSEFTSNYAVFSSRLNNVLNYFEPKYFNVELIIDCIKQLYNQTTNYQILEAVEQTNIYKYFINDELQVIITDVIEDLDRLKEKMNVYNRELKECVNELIAKEIKIDIKQIFDAVDNN